MPLLVDRWKAETIGEVEDNVQTGPGVILTHETCQMTWKDRNDE